MCEELVQTAIPRGGGGGTIKGHCDEHVGFTGAEQSRTDLATVFNKYRLKALAFTDQGVNRLFQVGGTLLAFYKMP